MELLIVCRREDHKERVLNAHVLGCFLVVRSSLWINNFTSTRYYSSVAWYCSMCDGYRGARLNSQGARFGRHWMIECERLQITIALL